VRRKRAVLSRGERLKIDEKDTMWKATAQFTEGVSLSEFKSLLLEYGRKRSGGLRGFVNPAIQAAEKIVRNVVPRPGVLPSNLLGLVQVVVFYLLRAQSVLTNSTRVSPLKAKFALMARTDFKSMFQQSLNSHENNLFKKIINSNHIPNELGLNANDQLFPNGFWGHYGGYWALFKKGVVTAAAKGNKSSITVCPNTVKRGTARWVRNVCFRYSGRHRRWRKRVLSRTNITVDRWLKSIIGRGRGKDILSEARYHRGSKSMGRFSVKTSGVEKGMGVFEVRTLGRMFGRIPYTRWLKFAEQRFCRAALGRPGSRLNYNGTMPRSGPGKCI
jgi:hypothetical protein